MDANILCILRTLDAVCTDSVTVCASCDPGPICTTSHDIITECTIMATDTTIVHIVSCDANTLSLRIT